MGIRASSTTTVSFADVRVPAENVLDVEGKGFKVAMAILNNGRTGLGGGAVGGMKTLIALAMQQAQARKQFGQPIADFGLMREKIAQMTIDCFAAESVVWMVAHYIDSGVDDYSVEAAISKVYASEAIQRSAYEALQIAAGSGFMRDYPYEQITRDCRILTIFEGTNEVLRLYIALSGLKDLGKSLGELKAAVDDIFNSPIKGFGVLTDYAEKRLTHATGVGRDKILGTDSGQLARGGRDLRKVHRGARQGVRLSCCASTARASPTVSTRSSAWPTSPSICSWACAYCRGPRRSPPKPGDPGEQAVGIAHVFAQQAKRRMANQRAAHRAQRGRGDGPAGRLHPGQRKLSLGRP